MNVEETLNRAADLIEEHGWTQGPDGWRVAGPYCALGAIGAAAEVREVLGRHCAWELIEEPAVAALAHYLEVRVGQDGAGVYKWNDEDERTADEVVEVLRAAAVVASARVESRVEVDA